MVLLLSASGILFGIQAVKPVLAKVSAPKAPIGPVNHPGIYLAGDHTGMNMAPGPYALTGGLLTINWGYIEKNSHDPASYDWSLIDEYLGEAGTMSKLVGLAFSTYNGRYHAGVVNALPDYMYDQHSPNYIPGLVIDAGACDATKEGCVNGRWLIPKYWDPQYESLYDDFIRRVGARYRDDPRVEWIAIGAGMYGEINAADGNGLAGDDAKDHIPLHDAGLDSTKWVQFVDHLIDTYVDAFSDPVTHKLKKVIFVQTATYTFSATERRDIAAYAASKGVGLSINGLYADQLFTSVPDHEGHWNIGLYDQLRLYGDQVPVAFETYDYMVGCDGVNQVYWAILNSLDKHVDYLRLNIDLFVNPRLDDQGGKIWDPPFASNKDGNIAIFRWAKDYIGKSIEPDSQNPPPGVFAAMREHRGPWITCWGGGPTDGQRESTYYPQYGDYQYWLYHRRDVPGGRDVPETRDITVDFLGNPYDPKNFNDNPYNAGLPRTKESWVTRRTDEGSGNPYMFFDIDNRYLFDINKTVSTTVTITVTYLDDNGDTWGLYYDSLDGVKAAYPLGSNQPYVQNDDPAPAGMGGGSWKKAQFVLTDARFKNGLDGGTDFKLDSRGDGDNWFHMIQVTKGESVPMPTPTPWSQPTATPLPTPTPTATPTTATIMGKVWNDLNQNGQIDAGEPGISGATVAIYLNGSTPSGSQPTDTSGYFTFPNLTPGYYLVRETNVNGYTDTTSNVQTAVISSGMVKIVNFGDYKEMANLSHFFYIPLIHR